MENSERDGHTRPLDLPLEKLCAGQEATVRTGHGTTDCFQIQKGVHQGYILSPCLIYMHSIINMFHILNQGMEQQTGSK